jgi:hypothetical protein
MVTLNGTFDNASTDFVSTALASTGDGDAADDVAPDVPALPELPDFPHPEMASAADASTARPATLARRTFT